MGHPAHKENRPMMKYSGGDQLIDHTACCSRNSQTTGIQQAPNVVLHGVFRVISFQEPHMI